MTTAGSRSTFAYAYLSLGALIGVVASQQLPVVNLTYQAYRASSYNESGQYYNFSNIRYGEPPLGQLRFAKPLPPQGQNTTVDSGTVGRICPQGVPNWLQVGGVPFLHAYTQSQPFNFTAANATSSTTVSGSPQSDPRETEDCLFLDVLVPKKTFDSSRATNSSASPVLVWIYGGGYATGDKTSYGNGAGLIHASQVSNSSGIVMVLLNYRLGAFGWLGGPTFQANATANAGLYDQRLALEWIQTNIHLFGGDPHQVTVMGESAGGGSILLQITAFGGSQPTPFKQAIIQSPVISTDITTQQSEQALEIFLQILNVSTIEQARQLPSDTLISANSKFIGESPYGNFILDPVVDGDIVPKSPGQLLLEGSFDHSIRVMDGHQSDEGIEFTRPYVTDNASFESLVQFWVPYAQPKDVDYISNVLYPALFDGTYPYRTQLDRGIHFVSEEIATCKTNWINRAFQNQTYAYIFSVPPGAHAQDTDYTFYGGPGTTDTFGFGTFNATVAQGLQQYITSFVATGVPNGGSDFPAFPTYGAGTLLNLTDQGFYPVPDTTANQRCVYWEEESFKQSNATTAVSEVTNDATSSSWGGAVWTTVTIILTNLFIL